MKKIYLFLIVCVLGGCSIFGQTRSYSAELQQWVGKNEYQLYNVWGAPTHIYYITPDKKMIVYVSDTSQGVNNPYVNQLYYQGMNPDNEWWDKIFGVPEKRQPDVYYCKTSFVVQNGIVVNYNFNGDNCVG